jgi:hypothetical protein
MEPSPPASALDQQIEKQTARQIGLQIYLPLGLGMVTLGAIGFWVVRRAFGTVSVWADVGLVLLVIPAFLLGLIVLVIFGAVTYAAFWLGGQIPGFFRRVREALEQVEGGIRRGADLSVKPVFGMRKVGAAVRSVGRGLRSIFRSF